MSSEKRKRSKKQPQTSRIYEIFVGSYINIAVKSLKNATSGGKISNLMIAGYFLDECEEYFYLGDNPGSVFAAVKKDDVASIMLSNEEVELMNQIDVPEGTEVQ